MAKRITYSEDKIGDLRKNVVSNNKKYKNPKNEFAVSNMDVNPANKNSKEYMMPWVRHIYSLFLKKRTWMGEGYHDIDIMRSFMEGNQPVDQYRDFLYGKSSNENVSRAIDAQGFDMRAATSTDKADRTAWVNIDEKPISIGPKIVTKLLEQARSMYYEVSVSAIDSMSVHSEEMDKAKLWFEKENREWMKAQRALMGIQDREPDFMPMNINELEMYALSGGFKVPYSINMEQLLKHTFTISDWDKEIAEKILKDFLALRYALIREYYDHEDKRIKIKYVDPRYGGIQYSRDNSFKDTEYGYELEDWPISKVRQKFDITHEEAASLAYAYSGEYGNPVISSWSNYGYYDEITGSLGFDFYRVPVFRCEWIDIDNEKYYNHVSKNGVTFRKPLKNKSPEGLEVYNNKVRYVREATWVVGTQYFTDYGKVKYISRPNPKKPRISYRGYRLGVPALFAQIRPFLNGLNLAYWKTQQAIGIAISNGIAVDVGALKNIAIGKDKTWDVTEILKYYRQQAILLHRKGNPMNFGQGGSSSPVTPLVTKMYENIVGQFAIMDRFMQAIESISGISLVSTGETPEPRIGKFNMQVALQGTNQIVGHIIRASTELQADVSTNAVYRMRGLIKSNPAVRKSYEDVIGKAKMQTVLTAEKSHVQYGISIEARDITEMKVFIEEVIAASIKGTSSGEGSGGLLDPSEAILVKDMMEQRQNMRMISMTLGYMLRRKGKERELAKLKAIEAQGAQLQKVEQQKEANKDKERMFELVKLDKEFKNDFTIKWGIAPTAEMARTVAEGMNVPGGAPAPQPPAGTPPQTPVEAPPVPPPA
jgi:hypothetical protein